MPRKRGAEAAERPTIGVPGRSKNPGQDSAAQRNDGDETPKKPSTASWRKLTDDDKAAMRVVLKADRALFVKLYPAVAPNQRHLMADLTGRRDAGTTTSTAPAGPSTASRGMSPDEQRLLSDKYRKEGMSLEDAINRAYSEAKASERSARGQA